MTDMGRAKQAEKWRKVGSCPQCGMVETHFSTRVPQVCECRSWIFWSLECAALLCILYFPIGMDLFEACEYHLLFCLHPCGSALPCVIIENENENVSGLMGTYIGLGEAYDVL